MVSDNKTDHPDRPRMPSQVTEHDFYRRDLVPTPTVPCVEQYDVPVAWHVIVSENGDGSVSDQTVREAMKVLNGWLNIHYKLRKLLIRILCRLGVNFSLKCFNIYRSRVSVVVYKYVEREN